MEKKRVSSAAVMTALTLVALCLVLRAPAPCPLPLPVWMGQRKKPRSAP